MLRRVTALLSAVLAGVAWGQETPSIERDLALVATIESGDTIQPG